MNRYERGHLAYDRIVDRRRVLDEARMYINAGETDEALMALLDFCERVQRFDEATTAERYELKCATARCVGAEAFAGRDGDATLGSRLSKLQSAAFHLAIGIGRIENLIRSQSLCDADLRALVRAEIFILKHRAADALCGPEAKEP
jgi:hypothetical protein